MLQIDSVRKAFVGGLELDTTTAHRRMQLGETTTVADLEIEFDRLAGEGVLSRRFSVKDPNEFSELRSFETKALLETFKKSRNPLVNKTTGETYQFDQCILIVYYRLLNPENIYPGLNPIEGHEKVEAGIFGCDAISFSKEDSEVQVRIYHDLLSFITECLNEMKVPPQCVVGIPTGDGYFVIFHGVEALAPVKLSYLLQKKIRETGKALPLRIGIDFGSVFVVRHKNQQINAIGHTLNSCARVMSFGKQNHILVSQKFYESFVSHSDEKHNFHEYGTRADKHGYEYKLFNYYKDSVGNQSTE